MVIRKGNNLPSSVRKSSSGLKSDGADEDMPDTEFKDGNRGGQYTAGSRERSAIYSVAENQQACVTLHREKANSISLGGQARARISVRITT